MYSYHPAGAVTAKNVQFSIPSADNYGNPTTGAGNVEVDYTYDQSGRLTTVDYPTTLWTSEFTTAYDSMGRPSTLNQSGGSNLANIQYDYAGRETTLSYLAPGSNGLASQTRAYNVNGQLASITGQYPVYPNIISNAGVQYVYSGTQNNGQITQAVDTISGETISYQYDSLKRLVSAASTPTSGSSAAPWTENFQYDGFGNMTAKTLNGTTTQMPVNGATNQLSYARYDASGNMTSGAGATMYYDGVNRLAMAYGPSGGVAYYGYDASNRRVYNQGLFTFYGAQGERLGVYQIYPCSTNCGGTNTNISVVSSNLWFGGHLIVDTYTGQSGSGGVFLDRLGTNRISGARFYPYGEEITSPQTTNDREKFATYTRDGLTGLDYADQRFYASTYGRFNSPDPFGGSAKLGNPISWNRYAYVGSDPVNRSDKTGLDWTNDYDYEAWTESYYTGGAITPGQEISAQSEAEYSANVTDVFNSSSSNSNSSSSSSSNSSPSNPSNTANPAPKCEEKILSAVNNQFGSNFTSADVTSEFQFSTGAPPGRGTLNLNISGGGAAPGRYPVNWWTYVVGYGSTLHIPTGPGGAESPLTLTDDGSQFTSHLDSAFPYNPIGLLAHLLLDMTGSGGYAPCP